MKTLKLIRIMPNTSVQVGAGCTAYTPGRYITAQNLDKLGLILKPLGIYQQVPESMMNAITALTACGSAYVYLYKSNDKVKIILNEYLFFRCIPS